MNANAIDIKTREETVLSLARECLDRANNDREYAKKLLSKELSDMPWLYDYCFSECAAIFIARSYLVSGSY